VCALLNAQPMGFYSPHTLVRDAVRHGVEVLGPCVNASRRDCTLELRSAAAGPVGHPEPGWHAAPSTRAMRIGPRYVRGLSAGLLDRIDQARADPSRGGGEFRDLEDFTRRTGAPVDALESLATAGAFTCLGVERREALWAAGALRDARPRLHGGVEERTLPGVVSGIESPMLPGMDPIEETAADLWATGLSASRHPTEFARERLAARGAVTASALRDLPHHSIVEVGGVVTHRQRPETASGVTFLNVEDETGLVNVICTPDVWRKYRKVARASPAIVVRGLLERHQGVINVLARRFEPLELLGAADRGDASLLRSRDFR
jgi:error-prone DNA polymerase